MPTRVRTFVGPGDLRRVMVCTCFAARNGARAWLFYDLPRLLIMKFTSLSLSSSEVYEVARISQTTPHTVARRLAGLHIRKGNCERIEAALRDLGYRVDALPPNGTEAA